MNASSIRAPLKDDQRRHRRRHRQAADRLRLPCADHEFPGAGHADDRADRIGIEGGAGSLLRRHDRDPAARSPRSRTAAGRSRPRRCATPRTPCTTSPTMRGAAPTAAPRAVSRRHLAHGQILVPGRPRRQRLWRPQSGVLVPAGGGLRAGGGVTAMASNGRVKGAPAVEYVVISSCEGHPNAA